MGLGRSELSFTVLEDSKIPSSTCPRWVVVGRSNVGKSSFLNALCHPKKIFYTSRHPGKTRGLVGAKLWLGKSEKSLLEIVDVPGFGFSPSQDHRFGSSWDVLLKVLQEQSQDRGLFWLWLVDPTRSPSFEEESLRKYLGQQSFALVFTKTDKIKNSQKKQILKNWEPYLARATEGPYWVSSLKGTGLEDLYKSARTFLRACAIESP